MPTLILLVLALVPWSPITHERGDAVAHGPRAKPAYDVAQSVAACLNTGFGYPAMTLPLANDIDESEELLATVTVADGIGMFFARTRRSPEAMPFGNRATVFRDDDPPRPPMAMVFVGPRRPPRAELADLVFPQAVACFEAAFD